MTHLEFHAVAALLSCYAFLMFATFCMAISRGLAWRKRQQASAATLPAIREALVDYLAGSNDLTRLKSFVKTTQWNVADAILEFQGTVGGAARDRLCVLTLDLGLLHQWCSDAQLPEAFARRAALARLAFACAYVPCQRVAEDRLLDALKDSDWEVRLDASRALLCGPMVMVERVFTLAVSQNLLIRVLLSQDLRPHALGLCRKIIPEALRSGDPKRVRATLQILIAWERALPLSNVGPLFVHPDREIRLLALRLAPGLPPSPENEPAILGALSGTDQELRALAARAAGRLGIEAALPALARCVVTGSAEVSRAAAAALAQMRVRGWTTLEVLSNHSNSIVAGVAGDALQLAHRQAGIL
jgi:HEAT repeats